MPSISTFARAIVVALALTCAPAFASTLLVTNVNDNGAGSLRDALGMAASGDTIAFGPGATGSILLLTELGVTQSVTIQGPGAANLVLDGQSTVRVMNITAGTVILSGVTIAHGKIAGLGGGISVADGATLAVSNSVFANNNAGNGGGITVAATGTLSVDTTTFHDNITTSVGGGGIMVFGLATVSDSTFLSNTASINGGAINNQPGGTLTLINSTAFENTSGGVGGALSNLGILTVVNSTFAFNQGSSGSAFGTGNTTFTIDNSVFADNASLNVGSHGAFDPGVSTGTARNNVFYNNTADGTVDDLTGYSTSNFIAATSEPLSALGNYGGPTQTMLPLPGRAAVCAGSIALLPPGLTHDQRGLPRTTLNGTTSCVDAGAAQTDPVLAVPALSTSLLALLGVLLAMFGIRRARLVVR